MNPGGLSATKAYPGFSQALLVVFLFLLFANLLAIPSVVLTALKHPHWAAWALFGGQLGGAALTLKVCLPLGGRTWTEAFPSRPVAWMVWPTTFVVAAGLILILSGLDTWVAHLLPPPAWLQRMFTDMGWPSLVLGAPLTEELLFRGLILGGFALRYGPHRGVLYSTLLFALVHLNPWQFPTGLLMGAFLGWLTLRTGSLWPPVFAHFLNNLAATVCQRFTIPYLSDSRFQPLWLWALGFLLVGAGLAALIRSAPGETDPSTPDATV